jgi:Plant transposon protein
MHAVWKIVPLDGRVHSKKREKSTIVLEAITDYHLWFWPASFGYAGALNDLNIHNLSPFLSSLLDFRWVLH